MEILTNFSKVLRITKPFQELALFCLSLSIGWIMLLIPYAIWLSLIQFFIKLTDMKSTVMTFLRCPHVFKDPFCCTLVVCWQYMLDVKALWYFPFDISWKKCGVLCVCVCWNGVTICFQAYDTQFSRAAIHRKGQIWHRHKPWRKIKFKRWSFLS